MEICRDTLLKALASAFNRPMEDAVWTTRPLHGGTLGDVWLVEGTAVPADGGALPFRLVRKCQKHFERPCDPDSWRREYDLVQSDFASLFSEGLRWPVCHHAELHEDHHELWLEYLNGTSGAALTVDQYEMAAEALGRFQGRLYATRPALLQTLPNLGKTSFLRDAYLRYRSWPVLRDWLASDACDIPKALRDMLSGFDAPETGVWERIEALPVVLCHRDFWVENIFCTENGIVLIDWDTTGWGCMGEDIASLIADETDPDIMVACYRRCVPAYYRGFSAYADVSGIADPCIRALMLVMFGLRMAEAVMFAPDGGKAEGVRCLEKIREMGDVDLRSLGFKG